MAKFRVTAPDGTTFEVNGPEGSTQEDAIRYVRQNYANLSPVRPQQQAAPSPKPEKELSWTDVPGEALSNFGESAVNFGKSVVAPFLDPVGTVQGLYDVGKGVASKAAGLVVEQDPKQKAETEAAANAVGEYFADRYGGLENLKKTIATDPVGVLADGSVVLTGGGTLAARGPGVVARAGNVARRAGNAIDPLQNVGRAIGATGTVAQHVLGQTTGAGSVPMRLAYDAGRQGGNVAFTDAMRGHAPVSDVVDMAENAVQNLTRERGAAYRANMANTLADQAALNVQPINTAVADAMQSVTYQGQPINTAAVQALRRTERTVNRFANIPGNQGTIAAGLDAMKKAVGGILEEYKPGTQPYRVVKQVYDEIGNQIRAQVPDYDNAMRAYTQASDQLSDLRRTFSIDHKAAPDTTARKLLSVTRNNVNTNYGERARLFDVLSHQPGAENLPYAVAGHAMSSATPRGLQGVAATGTGATALMTNPKALAMLPFFSPRLMGEATYAAGLTANQIEALARRMRMSPERVRQILMTSYATDTVANAEDEPEGRADGGRVDGAPQMDSKYRRAYIKQGLAQGRTYGDLMRELHAPAQQPSGLGGDAGQYLQRLPAQINREENVDHYLDRRRVPVFQGDPNQFLQRLADGGDVRDPMREINKRFDPITPASRRGVMRESEMRSGNIPSTMERVGSAVMDYGPVPARLATDIAMQPVRAGEAVADAVMDPSLENVSDAAFQTGMAIGKPLAGAGAFGLGMIEAARRDFAPNITPRSAFSRDDPLSADQRERLNLLMRRSRTKRGLSDAEQREVDSLNQIVREVQIAKATAGTKAAEQRTANEEAQRAADAKAKAEEEKAARTRANLAYASGLATDRRFSDTYTGRMFDKLGPFAPGAVAMGTGAITGAGMRGMGVSGKRALYGVPAGLGALVGGASAHWPMAYEAMYAPTINPSFQAALNYIREAPPGDPRAAQLKQMLDDGTIKQPNPVRDEAEKNLYDPVKFAERTALGVAEGVPGGVAGSELLPAAKYLIRSAPKAAYEIGQIPGRAGRGLVDGFRSGSRGQVPPNSGNNPPPPPPPSAAVEYKRYDSVPQAERDKILTAYGIARQLQGGGDLPADAADQITQAYGKRNIKMPNLKKRLGATNKAISDEVARTGAEPPISEYSRLRTKDTFAVPLAIGTGAGVAATAMDDEREERKDGGAVARANRAMSRHWEKQNRYARGGTVHRRGMFKKGLREG